MGTLVRYQLNGAMAETKQNTSILSVLQTLTLNPALVIVEKNNTRITTDTLGSSIIKDGDIIEIIRYVGGGTEPKPQQMIPTTIPNIAPDILSDRECLLLGTFILKSRII